MSSATPTGQITTAEATRAWTFVAPSNSSLLMAGR